jgi:NTE family protein
MTTAFARHLLLVVLLALGAVANAADLPARPRVGLVLGGGGARGAAHIGVLEVLERLRVPVDCVAGTSMGGLVAGAYAAGLSPAVMREELAKADWDDLFHDDPSFSQQNFRKKVLDRRFLPASETGVGPDGLKYQTGVVTGQKIKLFFNQLVGDYLGEREIDRLPLPLSIIATDIVQGQRVVFRSGSLTTAMRASMSVPGLMSPVEINGEKLVDGGLVDNVPIGEARSRCQADVVIAVNVGSPLLKAEDISGLLSISVQMVNILTEQNVTRSLATLKATDIYIKPDLEGISAGDFKRTSETADRGVTAAESVADRLRLLAVSESAYAAWTENIQVARREAPKIHEIQIAGLRLVNPAMVEQHIQVKPGDPVNPSVINPDLLRVYGDGYYQNVDYAMLDTLREPQHSARDAPRKKLGTRLHSLRHQPRQQFQERLQLQSAPWLPKDLAQLAGCRTPGHWRDRLVQRSLRGLLPACRRSSPRSRVAVVRNSRLRSSGRATGIETEVMMTHQHLAVYRPRNRCFVQPEMLHPGLATWTSCQEDLFV